ncbi:LOW QUALITY PROTEIN: hypothetical protein GX51_06480 [Blastomyces parvus]|uniref:Uncharacterized protein n=1 Tax=Blastomyces parvus TaxID=2060905 RepID=A0A2B7WHZ4_9EURO|nr:LOW QUALITY PROTEIN: hypothetical protein GX51_06480 [Blastomyces parvus]
MGLRQPVSSEQLQRATPQALGDGRGKVKRKKPSPSPKYWKQMHVPIECEDDQNAVTHIPTKLEGQRVLYDNNRFDNMALVIFAEFNHELTGVEWW